MAQRVTKHPFQTTWIRSKPNPTKIKEKIQKYFCMRPSRPDNIRYSSALFKAKDAFRLPYRVNPFHVNDVIRHYSHPDRSPGLPYTKEGLKRKDEVDPNRIKWAVHAMKYGIWNKCRTPCNAVAKTAVHPSEEKLRLIWVYPAHMTFAEGMFAMPLIRAYKKQVGSPYGIWIRYQCGDMRYLRSKKPESHTWLAADWSGFDATVPPWLIRDAFSILLENVDLSRYEFHGIPTDNTSLPRLWKTVVNYFINTPIKDPDGLVRVKSGGVPSGSYFTNLIDSIVNYIACAYILGDTGYPGAFYVMGDDVLVAIKGDGFCLEKFATQAKEVFGFELNLSKTEIGEFPSFLGFKFTRSGVPDSDYNKLMAQLLLPSRPDRTREEFYARIRALQLASFGGNKRFLYETQNYLESVGCPHPPRALHRRDELSDKLEHLGLAGWPPLDSVLAI